MYDERDRDSRHVQEHSHAEFPKGKCKIFVAGAVIVDCICSKRLGPHDIGNKK